VKKWVGSGVRAGLALTALVAGCNRSDAPVTPRRAGEALRQAARRLAPPFRPPVDGLVTDQQVDQYIRVRRAAKGRTDAETARALGIAPEEISWTRARVVEVLVALDEKRVREASAEVYAKALSSLRDTRAKTRDPADIRVLDEQIAALERERATVRQEETPSTVLLSNMRRIAGRRAELEALAP